MAKSRKKRRAALANSNNTPPTARSMEAAIAEPVPEEKPSDSEISFYWNVAAVILVVAIILRQWHLADAPVHPDEAIHGTGALAIATYTYNPVFHGPLLYHLTAIVFALFPDNEFTMRLVPSLMGIGLIALMLWALPRYLGWRATLWASGLLAISPVMVSYSRRLIHDSLVALLTLVAVLCFQIASENSSRTPAGRWARVGVALSLTLFIATKANAFFVIAMLIAFWFARVWSPQSKTERANRFWSAPLPAWLPLAALAVASGISIWALRNGQVEFHEQVLKYSSVVLALIVWEWIRRAPFDAPVTEDNRSESPPRFPDLITPAIAIVLSLCTAMFLFGHGVLWLQTPGPLGKAWTETMGSRPLLGSADAPGALRRMIEYWGGQQKSPRLPGPHDYYLVLMLLYELPIALAAIGGLLVAGKKRTLFTDLVVWWAFTSCVVYAMANEKVPWLMVHLILPLGLLAGLGLSVFYDWAVRMRLRPASIGLCGLGFIYLMRGTVATNFERAADHHEPMFYAQTTDAFQDAFNDGLKASQNQTDAIWVDHSKQWPMAWYLRDSKKRLGSDTEWDTLPVVGRPLRMAIQPCVFDWNTQINNKAITREQYAEVQSQLAGFKNTQADFYIWPRASWPALCPDRWAKWWWGRDAGTDKDDIGFLSEWSSSPGVVSVRP